MYNIDMNRKHLIIRVSDDERALIKEGAKKRGRNVSEYLRWLVRVDKDARYQLTEAGRAALEDKKGEG